MIVFIILILLLGTGAYCLFIDNDHDPFDFPY